MTGIDHRSAAAVGGGDATAIELLCAVHSSQWARSPIGWVAVWAM